jgi:hypothetical protein
LQATPAVASTLCKQPTNQQTVSSFRESFIYGGKQGGGAIFLGEGCDIVTAETCDPTL